ncbi:hypothetical protein [Allorhizocola rhizosphaerae]|uniref:hypothetical protein n=1 Tax=Allorhizocola rhizosphaerae TaxID=1872709 RepID=UPI000E3D57F2|nr:hypothetical protein [Allorhizocola rhizosphaerae]
MNITQRLAFAASAAAFILVPATGAHAAAPDRHCVISVMPGATMTCYSSFATAIAKATGGRVVDAPADPKAALNDQGFAVKLNSLGDASNSATTAATTASNVVISIEYSDDDYYGYTYTISAPWGCDDDINEPDWKLTSMASGWNDEVESFKSYAGCAAMHWLHIGASTEFGPGDNAYYYYRSGFPDWLSDEISSISWS